jgi:hypothetical protein
VGGKWQLVHKSCSCIDHRLKPGALTVWEAGQNRQAVLQFGEDKGGHEGDGKRARDGSADLSKLSESTEARGENFRHVR